MINLTADDIAKVEGGRLKPEEVELFKRLLAAVANSADKEVPLDVLNDERGKLTTAQFDAFMNDLITSQWLAQDDELNITYGPRSYLELADDIRKHGADVPQMVTY